ncbi:MAG: cytochrome c [Cellvibrio sp.]|uniref:c-type cytochrome n=1 Tax=Cellvibrio sp. TaxID=1965322 RepID=UPI0031ADFA02
MTRVSKIALALKLLGAALLVSVSAGSFAADDAKAQTAAADPAAAKQAIAVRKAAFVLIANNFKPIGEVLQGKAAYNQADIVKRAERVAFLSLLLDGTFPEGSNLGAPHTKSKPEVWTKKADFDKQIKDFQVNAAALAQIAAKESTASDAFKKAAKAVAEGCKGCHDGYKEK